MGRDTAARDDCQQQDKRRAGMQRMDELLQELLAQYSLQFPQLKIVIIGRTDEIQAGLP